ncbi:MAG: hypothetical protein Pars2KO_11050 [Parasphingorhabdus sp.]
MAFVITQNCCNDAVCVEVCPADCIEPRPNSADYKNAEMLYIDPSRCTNCEACYEVCPVGAIYPENRLPDNLKRYAEINAQFFLNRDAGETE